MEDPRMLGRLLLILGLALAGIGALLVLGGKLPWFGRLPGDIRVEREGFRLWIPLTTSLLISAVLTLVLYLMRRR